MVLQGVADICQLLVVPICLIGNIPQWLTIIRNQTSQKISLSSYFIFGLGSFFCLFYAAVQYLSGGGGYPIFIASVANFFCIVLSIFVILLYRPRRSSIIQYNETRSFLLENQSEEKQVTQTRYDNRMHEISRPYIG